MIGNPADVIGNRPNYGFGERGLSKTTISFVCVSHVWGKNPLGYSSLMVCYLGCYNR